MILRDPVERAHSNWTHLWSAGLEPVGDFVRACAEEERRIAAGWASFWHYTGLGKYGEQLDYAFSLFPRDQVLVLRYRLLVDSPAAALDQICAFLGVETGHRHRDAAGERHRAAGAHACPPGRVRSACAASDAAGRLLPGDAAAAATHRLERFLQRGGTQRQPLGWEQRQALLPGVRDDIKLLETRARRGLQLLACAPATARAAWSAPARPARPRPRTAAASDKPAASRGQRSSVTSACDPSRCAIS